MPPTRRLSTSGAASLALCAVLLVSACMTDGASSTPNSTPNSTASPTEQAEQAVSPPGAASGIGDDYWPQDGNRGIDVRHYDIHDTYRFEAGELSGRTAITLRATRDLTSFNLDFLLPVTDVTVDGADAEHETPTGHELTITPAEPLARGDVVVVEVGYAGTPGDYSYAGESNWLASGREVVAMNQPHMAPWWFPSNDHPRDKATFDVTVTGPADYQVVSNGLPVDRRTSGDQATTHWRSKHPMATYLAFFALGRFDITRGDRKGLPYYVAVSKQISRSARATATRVLSKSPQVTAWLARRLGPYPFESTGGLTTSLPVGFALENQTRPTYPTSFGSSASVIVHELAHQWFGDSVSVHRWRDIWLNEGFATFMEVAYDEAHRGQPGRAWLQEQYYDRRGDDAFWKLDIADPGAAHVFDGPVYSRGGMALQALRNRIGDRDFWKILRTWAADRRYGDGTVPQFEKLVHTVSGRDVDRFFDVWLREGRAPARTKANGLR